MDPFTFKDIIYTIAGVFWILYLPLEIFKMVRGKDKATVADVAALQRSVEALAQAMEETQKEHARTQRGIDRDLGALTTTTAHLSQAAAAMLQSIQDVRKELDSKLGQVHRRFDNLPHGCPTGGKQ